MIQYQHHGVTVLRSALYMTNSTIIHPGDAVMLMDPSQTKSWPFGGTSTALAERPLYMAVTHSHYDHIIGAGAFPEAITVASQALADRKDFHEPSNEIGDFDDQWYLEALIPSSIPPFNTLSNVLPSSSKAA